ncbi:hypothetical protein RFI_26388 [Reticulomyxa filosa]|uniref:Uncharacterized protein n=1 Tax=Reticulomyxa filosa TaxID=46433 RepID=X6MC21_RETFI|nr:hypothetical protein RFI_26388 [Reticulomyxa filosa]|eukprot:ETO10987.1 hypothetical protein RFI_26388 [Reticulomyxa filosa]
MLTTLKKLHIKVITTSKIFKKLINKIYQIVFVKEMTVSIVSFIVVKFYIDPLFQSFDKQIVGSKIRFLFNITPNLHEKKKTNSFEKMATTIGNENESRLNYHLQFVSTFVCPYVFCVWLVFEVVRRSIDPNHWIRSLHIKFGWINEFDKLLLIMLSLCLLFDNNYLFDVIIYIIIYTSNCLHDRYVP